MKMMPSTVRLLAVVMVIVVLVTVMAPARAEAVDVLVIAGIASLAIAGVILLAYLIVAAGSDRGSDARLEAPERGLLVHVAQTP